VESNFVAAYLQGHQHPSASDLAAKEFTLRSEQEFLLIKNETESVFSSVRD
jgi:hypothetical protein